MWRHENSYGDSGIESRNQLVATSKPKTMLVVEIRRNLCSNWGWKSNLQYKTKTFNLNLNPKTHFKSGQFLQIYVCFILICNRLFCVCELWVRFCVLVFFLFIVCFNYFENCTEFNKNKKYKKGKSTSFISLNVCSSINSFSYKSWIIFVPSLSTFLTVAKSNTVVQSYIFCFVFDWYCGQKKKKEKQTKKHMVMHTQC